MDYSDQLFLDARMDGSGCVQQLDIRPRVSRPTPSDITEDSQAKHTRMLSKA